MKTPKLVYYRTAEQIKKYSAVPVKEKLRWLEEANVFLAKAMPAKYKRIRGKYREGKLGS